MREHGLVEDERRWWENYAYAFDILGLDYYAHAEMEWRWSAEEDRSVLRFPGGPPRGFAEVASD